jgi:hypothetical protein
MTRQRSKPVPEHITALPEWMASEKDAGFDPDVITHLEQLVQASKLLDLAHAATLDPDDPEDTVGDGTTYRAKTTTRLACLNYHEQVIKPLLAEWEATKDQKKANTAIRNMVVNGVNIVSRHHKIEEMNAMGEVIARLPDTDTAAIDEIRCNGSAERTYSIALRPGYDIDPALLIGKLATLFDDNFKLIELFDGGRMVLNLDNSGEIREPPAGQLFGP